MMVMIARDLRSFRREFAKLPRDFAVIGRD